MQAVVALVLATKVYSCGNRMPATLAYHKSAMPLTKPQYGQTLHTLKFTNSQFLSLASEGRDEYDDHNDQQQLSANVFD